MRLSHLILQALTTLGETFYPHVDYDVYVRAAFDEIIRREWG